MRKRVLIANDDGIGAVGIIALAEAFSKYYDITVVAPLTEQSGKSHSFTYQDSIRYKEVNFPVEGTKAYAVDGTPADCVKVAVDYLLDERPEYIISGINSGHNSGVAVFYSGTIAAAREGALGGIPSVAFSTSYGHDTVEDMMRFALESLKIFEKLLGDGHLSVGANYFYSVNFPGVPIDECLGVKVARQSMSYYRDRYTNEGSDGDMVKVSFTGELVNIEDSFEFDVRANIDKYITITPISTDSTADSEIAKLNSFENMRIDIKEQK